MTRRGRRLPRTTGRRLLYPALVGRLGDVQHPGFGVAEARYLIPLLVCPGVGLADSVIGCPVPLGQRMHLAGDVPHGPRVERVKGLGVGHVLLYLRSSGGGTS